MITNHRRVRQAALAACLIPLIAACTSKTSEPPVTIPSTPPPATSASQMRDVPLYSYVLSPRDAGTFENARIILMNQCAIRFGVDSPLRPDNNLMASDPTFDNRFGSVFNVADAKKYGYGSNPKDSIQIDPERDRSSNQETRDPTEHESLVLYGSLNEGIPNLTAKLAAITDKNGSPVPEHGCYGEVTLALQDGTDSRGLLLQLVLDGIAEVDSEIDQDQRTKDANSAYSECMKPKGYDVKDPLSTSNLSAGKPDAEQKRIAVDVATCAVQVNYFGIIHALDVAYQQRYIAQHAAEFKSLKDGRDKAMIKAKEIVARGQ